MRSGFDVRHVSVGAHTHFKLAITEKKGDIAAARDVVPEEPDGPTAGQRDAYVSAHFIHECRGLSRAGSELRQRRNAGLISGVHGG